MFMFCSNILSVSNENGSLCFVIGHYIPQLAVALLDHNEHSKDFKFNIKGVAVRTYYSYILLLDFHFL